MNPIMPLAYQFVLLTLMLGEINFTCARLGLPVSLPIRTNDLTTVFICDYRLCKYGASVETRQYRFDFSESGRLCYVTRLTEPGGLSFFDYQRTLSSTNVSLSTNDAYRVALEWLRNMDVSVNRLEKEHPVMIKFHLHSRSGENVKVPVFRLDWGETPTVEVSLSAVSGDLLRLRQEDDSYSSRPAGLIQNVDKLLAIPDAEFLKYTPEQRSNLVVQFAAVQYPPTTNHPTSTNGSSIKTLPQEKPKATLPK